MTEARIYQQSKTAMQSGRARAKSWVLELETEKPRFIEPLMGWTGARDMNGQVKMIFDTKEEALAFAESKGLKAQVIPVQTRKVKPKSYADNFKWDKIQ